MQGLEPWKILKPRLAVNKPTTAWVNAVTRVLTTLDIRFGDVQEIRFDRPNRDGSYWEIIFPNWWADPLGVDYHFKLKFADPTTIHVLGGRRIRDTKGFQSVVSLTGDTGASPTVDLYKTVNISSSVYIWLELDNALTPTTLTVNTNSVYPTDNDGRYLVLGYVTWDSGTSAISNIEPFYVGGDWRDQWEVYDNASLDYSTVDHTQIHDFDVAVPEAIDYNDDFIPFKDVDDNEIAWCSIAGIVAAINSESPPPVVGLPGPHDQTDYAQSLTPDTGWNYGGTKGGEQNEQHDARYWKFATASAGTNAYGGSGVAEDKDFYTTGECRADDFRLVDDPTNNFWNGEDLAVLVTSEANIKASGDINIQTTTADLGLIGFDGVSLSCLNNQVEIFASTYLDLQPSGALRINGTDGVTITNWTNKGMLTGGSIVEILQTDLQATDKLLVYRP
jgi:hypothetical protein